MTPRAPFQVKGGLTRQDETNIIAAIALAAQQYADPSSLIETLAKFSPAAAARLRERLAEREEL